MGDLENPVEPEKPDSELTQWRLRSRSCAVADMTGAAAALCDEQLQRVGRQLLHREVKTRDIRAPLPLPDLCVTRSQAPQPQQDAGKEAPTPDTQLLLLAERICY